MSNTLLQAAGQAASVPVRQDFAAPAVGPFTVEFLLHAAFIWAALIVICLIVFGYRRIRGKESCNDLSDVYQRQLEEMRKQPGKS
ncbi:MAG: hypothetical protein CL535_00320 [Ahrensia sp.]|nr:hypothetical protein [Ahrensia sp.]